MTAHVSICHLTGDGMIEAMAWIVPQAQDIKVFCFFSSEKKTFLSRS